MNKKIQQGIELTARDRRLLDLAEKNYADERAVIFHVRCVRDFEAYMRKEMQESPQHFVGWCTRINAPHSEF